jgi:DNA polymerase III subunit chi
MTEVEFHTGVPDPVLFACRLLRKAVRLGVRVQVTAQPARLAQLDRALWIFEERDFVPHVRVPGVGDGVARRTPLWLCEQAQAVDAPSVLVNLGAPVPDPLPALQRLIEVVGADAEEAAAGRARWRHYKGLGLEVRHHAVSAAAPARDPGEPDA